MTAATIAAGYPRGLVDFVVTQGADRVELLRQSGICEETLAHQDNRVPVKDYVRLFDVASDHTGMPAVSLEYGKAVRMQEISIVGLICEACESVLDVPKQLNRYAALVVDDNRFEPATILRGVTRGSQTWIEGPSTLFSDYPVIAECELARLVWNTRAMFVDVPEFKKIRFPRTVHLMRSAPKYKADFERIFEAPVVFDSTWNALQIDPEFLSLKQPPVNRYVFGVLSERADSLLNELRLSKTVRGRVETVLMEILHTGEASMDVVAARLGQSRQTLYRKLKEEGVTYEQVLDGLRQKLAVHFLSGKQVSVNQTAYLLGFSDPASFSRAFKRWTGESPRAVHQRRSPLKPRNQTRSM